MSRKATQAAPINFDDIAHLIAKEWYRLAVRDLSSEWFLYYRTAREGERIALPIPSREFDAPDGYTRGIKISVAWGVDTATRHIADAMRTLPILGHE